MRTLIYKRTHVGDPDERGRFGIYDCMGRIRDYNFEAVMGVGGISREPQSFEIDRKINWVGIGAKKAHFRGATGKLITFDTFLLLDELGPLVETLAPTSPSGYTKKEPASFSGTTLTWSVRR